MNCAGIWKTALRCLTCMTKQTHCFALVNLFEKVYVPNLKDALVTCSLLLAVCKYFLTFVFRSLIRKCLCHILFVYYGMW